MRRWDWRTIIAIVIEFSVAVVLLPRWIPALMLAEGNQMPETWESWWIPMSAIFNGGMAVVEAVAIAYVFYAWHHTTGQEAKRLLVLIALMLITFSMVLAPFVASSVGNVAIKELLENPGQYGMSLIWGTAVVLSTSFTVMAVGIAQGTGGNKKTVEFCWCGQVIGDDHKSTDHIDEIVEVGSPIDAVEYLREKYSESRNLVIPPIPNIVEVARTIKNEVHSAQSE